MSVALFFAFGIFTLGLKLCGDSMFKKISLLFLMFTSVQVKPFGIVEILALVGCGAIVRTRPAQILIRQAWAKFVRPQGAALPASNSGQGEFKIDQGATQQLEAWLCGAKKSALQSSRNLAAVLVAMKNNVKTLSLGSVRQTETRINTNQCCASQSSSFNGSSAGYDQSEYFKFTQIHAQQIKTEASGLFPRITNNYYSGKPEEVVEEFGNKKFWQGTFAGGLITAWMLKPQSPKQEKESKA